MKQGLEICMHDQTGKGSCDPKKGYGEVGKVVAEEVGDKKPNISYLITINEKGLVHCQAKNGGTKRFALLSF